ADYGRTFVPQKQLNNIQAAGLNTLKRFVSGHNFSCADSLLSTWAFSPCYGVHLFFGLPRIDSWAGVRYPCDRRLPCLYWSDCCLSWRDIRSQAISISRHTIAQAG